jgi:hypothetical protein
MMIVMLAMQTQVYINEPSKLVLKSTVSVTLRLLLLLNLEWNLELFYQILQIGSDEDSYCYTLC